MAARPIAGEDQQKRARAPSNRRRSDKRVPSHMMSATPTIWPSRMIGAPKGEPIVARYAHRLKLAGLQHAGGDARRSTTLYPAGSHRLPCEHGVRRHRAQKAGAPLRVRRSLRRPSQVQAVPYRPTAIMSPAIASHMHAPSALRDVCSLLAEALPLSAPYISIAAESAAVTASKNPVNNTARVSQPFRAALALPCSLNSRMKSLQEARIKARTREDVLRRSLVITP